MCNNVKSRKVVNRILLNVISTQIENARPNGANKVLNNLIKGLDHIEYPYVLNRDLNSTENIWIHDDICAARYVKSQKINTIYGPNLYNNPTMIETGVEFKDGIYLQPCDWAKSVWKAMGFVDCPIRVWPVGIDTEKFAERDNKVGITNDILLYHKKRSKEELHSIEEQIGKAKYTYTKIEYGSYTEEQYIDALRKSRYLVWHGCPESQGIALLEALSMNVPMLVIDATCIEDEIDSDEVYDKLPDVVQVTTAPYFDSRCGLKIESVAHLQEAFDVMESKIRHYAPREYIVNNMSIVGQAKKFVEIVESGAKSEKYNPSKVTNAWREPHREKLRKYVYRLNSALRRRLQK